MKKHIPRPLSPHIQIYKPMLTMIMSIVHRVSGVLLYFGSLLLAWWLIAAATGPHYFGIVNQHFASIPGRLILLGYTWALVHHMLGGIKHLVWDTGSGLSKPAVEIWAWGSLIGSIVITVLIWYLAYAYRATN